MSVTTNQNVVPQLFRSLPHEKYITTGTSLSSNIELITVIKLLKAIKTDIRTEDLDAELDVVFIGNTKEGISLVAFLVQIAP